MKAIMFDEFGKAEVLRLAEVPEPTAARDGAEDPLPV